MLFPPSSIRSAAVFHFPVYHILMECFSCHFFKSCAEITPTHPDPFSRVFRAQLLPDVLIHIQDDSSKRTCFIEYIIKVASGEFVNNEKKGYKEIAIFKTGVTL